MNENTQPHYFHHKRWMIFTSRVGKQWQIGQKRLKVYRIKARKGEQTNVTHSTYISQSMGLWIENVLTKRKNKIHYLEKKTNFDVKN